MKSRMSSILIGVGVLAALVAVWQFYLFVIFRDTRGALDAQGGGSHLWLAILAAVVACASVGFGIFRNINQTEEFHITS